MATTASEQRTEQPAVTPTTTLHQKAVMQLTLAFASSKLLNMFYCITAVLRTDHDLTANIRDRLDSIRDFLAVPYDKDKTKLTEEERAIADSLINEFYPDNVHAAAPFARADNYRHVVLCQLYTMTRPDFLDLVEALIDGDSEIVMEILARREIAIITDLYDRSILDIAIDFNRPNNLNRLLQYAKEMEPTNLKFLFHSEDNEKTTVLTRTVNKASALPSDLLDGQGKSLKENAHQMVKHLLRCGIDLNSNTEYTKPPLSVAFDNTNGYDVAITLLQHESRLDSEDSNLVPALLHAFRQVTRCPGVSKKIQALTLEQLQLETELAYQTEINALYMDPKNKKEKDELYTVALKQSEIGRLLEKEADRLHGAMYSGTWWSDEGVMSAAEANGLIPTVQQAIKEHVVLPIVQRATLKEPYTSLVACFNHSNTYPEQALNLMTEYSHGSYRPSLNFSLFSLHRARFKQLRLEQRLQQLQNSLNETREILNEADDLLDRIKNGFSPN